LRGSCACHTSLSLSGRACKLRVPVLRSRTFSQCRMQREENSYAFDVARFLCLSHEPVIIWAGMQIARAGASFANLQPIHGVRLSITGT
ncbi:MAG: hypothetical protein ACK515_00005, partial [bacterium]